MDYRLLSNAEKSKLTEIHPEYASVDLSQVTIAGAVENGEVKALLVLNFVPHAEPLWIEEGAHVDFRRLAAILEPRVPGNRVWVFVPNDKIGQMAEICGLHDTGLRVYSKELT